MYSSVLTKIGAAQLLNSQIIGTTLKWSKMGVGDGGGHTVTPDANKTALAREKYRAGINHLYRDPQDPTQIIAELVMLPEEGGYTIREVGIYDTDDNLVVYGSLPEVVKPVLAEGSGVTLTIRCRAAIGNAANIKLIIDPSTVIATRQYVGDVLQKYFPLTGGTLTGNIVYNGNSDFSIVRYTDTGRTVLRGGTNYNDGASIYLNGKNYSGDVGAPGAMKIIASNGTQSGTLDLSPDGTLTLNGVDIATKQSNVASASKLETPRKINGEYFDGTQDITITDDTKLLLSGGTISGNIIADKQDFNITRANAKGRTIIRGGTNYDDGASIYLYGKDFSDVSGSEGDFIILVYNATQNSKFQLSPSGTMKLNNQNVATQPYVDNLLTGYLPLTGGTLTGSLTLPFLSCNKNDNNNKNFDFAMPRSNGGGYFLDGEGNLNKNWYKILTRRDQPYEAAPLPKTAGGVGQFFSSVFTGSSFTLPSGGTWQYIALLQFDNGVFSTGGRGGIGAGGTTITLDAQGHSVCRTLCFFWRLA
ncbi:phage tail protein [Pyramidobacter piscolens]|uniref:phage tail protein n=1 Tax=Pyramidobacter piscolens TaxID=638849 RepID=UPI002AB0357B|nr:phage tail protein [Pyramidobacter piscolens]